MKKILTVIGILILLNGFHAVLALGCSFDTDCQPGSRCLKAPGAIYGVCGGGLFLGNTYDRQPVYDPLDPNRTVGKTCSFDTDCGPGNRCLKESDAIYGVCVRGQKRTLYDSG
jgi:hypothetical protein